MTQVTGVDGVADDVSPALPSEDGLAMQAFVPIDSSADVGDVVTALGEKLRGSVPDGVDVAVTGPAGFTADLAAGFAGIDGLLLGVALIAVLIILVLVYRSVLLPFVVLSTSLFALCVALLVVWWLAKWDVLLLSGQTQGILFILVIGAATDYALLFVSRFREELRRSADKGSAITAAWKGSLEPILASGGTVIAGLLCLLLSDLKSNSTLGPVAAIGIVFAMLSALTLLPALLYAFGRTAFWPRAPRIDDRRDAPEEREAFRPARSRGTGVPARGSRSDRTDPHAESPGCGPLGARRRARRPAAALGLAAHHGRTHRGRRIRSAAAGRRRAAVGSRARRFGSARRPGGSRRAFPRRIRQPCLRHRTGGRDAGDGRRSALERWRH